MFIALFNVIDWSLDSEIWNEIEVERPKYVLPEPHMVPLIWTKDLHYLYRT